MNTLNSAFARLDQIAPFMHISIAVLFIALEITVVVCGHYCFRDIEQNPHRYKLILKEFNKFLFIALAMVGFLLFSGIYMSYSNYFPIGDPMVEAIVKTKIAILIFICAMQNHMIFEAGNAEKCLFDWLFCGTPNFLAPDEIVLVFW